MKKDFHAVAERIAALTTKKNKAYGDSFEKSIEILIALFPNGIPVSSYGSLLTIVRVIDKLFRIVTDKDAFGESPWDDICGYALLEATKAEDEKINRCSSTYHVLDHDQISLYEDLTIDEIRSYIDEGMLESGSRGIDSCQCLGLTDVDDLANLILSEKGFDVYEFVQRIINDN